MLLVCSLSPSDAAAIAGAAMPVLVGAWGIRLVIRLLK
jgi:hypothetical protein